MPFCKFSRIGRNHDVQVRVVAELPDWIHDACQGALVVLGRNADDQARDRVIFKRSGNFPMKISRDMPAFYPWWQPREFKYY